MHETRRPRRRLATWLGVAAASVVSINPIAEAAIQMDEQRSVREAVSAETRFTRQALEENKAKFVYNFRSKTGVEFDIYQTTVGNQQPFTVDPDKFDNLVGYVLERLEVYSGQQTVYPPEAMKALIARGRKGQLLDTTMTIILSNDSSTCITRSADKTTINNYFVVPSERSECVYIGTSRSYPSQVPTRTRKHLPVILAGGSTYALTVAPLDYAAAQYLLHPNLRMLTGVIEDSPNRQTPPRLFEVTDAGVNNTSLLAHELGHGFSSLLDLPPDRTLADNEHRQIVYPLENDVRFRCVVDPAKSIIMPIEPVAA